jgi:hypothetical protein
MTTDELREKFEAWYINRYKDYWKAVGCGASKKIIFKLRDDGETYEKGVVQDAWEVYQEIYQAAHEELQAEIDALRKDGERLAWIMSHTDEFEKYMAHLKLDDMLKAIDQAIAKGE